VGFNFLEGEESMSEQRETMTEGEFAKAVGLSRITLWRMRQKGELPHYRVGNRVLYGQHHIAEFLKAHELRIERRERI
jgi:excisionase family DNA binding protein